MCKTAWLVSLFIVYPTRVSSVYPHCVLQCRERTACEVTRCGPRRRQVRRGSRRRCRSAASGCTRVSTGRPRGSSSACPRSRSARVAVAPRCPGTCGAAAPPGDACYGAAGPCRRSTSRSYGPASTRPPDALPLMAVICTFFWSQSLTNKNFGSFNNFN